MSTQLSVIERESDYSDAQVELIRKTVAAGCSNDELALFLEVCRGSGLNPFMKQIYAIKRGDKMTVQTGIDGYRLLAARTGALAGIDDALYDSEEGEHPAWAQVTVWRLVQGQRVPFSAKARWREYAGLNKDGNPVAMWAKMPWLMLGKCAEALALRKAFPAELSGVYTAEEMEQADNPPTPYVEATMQGQTPVTRLLDRVDKALTDPQVQELLIKLGRETREDQGGEIAGVIDFIEHAGQTVNLKSIKHELGARIADRVAPALDKVDMGAPGN